MPPGPDDERIRRLATAFGVASDGAGDLDGVADAVCVAAGLPLEDPDAEGEAIGGTLGAVRTVVSALVVHDAVWAWAGGGPPPTPERLGDLVRTVAMNTPEVAPETIVQTVVTTVRGRLGAAA